MDINKLIKIAQAVGDVVKVVSPAATEIRARLAAARVEVTEAEWDELAAGWVSIGDTARSEIARKD